MNTTDRRVKPQDDTVEQAYERAVVARDADEIERLSILLRERRGRARAEKTRD